MSHNEAAWPQKECLIWSMGTSQIWLHGKKIERHKIEATRIILTYPSQVKVDLDVGHVFEPFSLKIEKQCCKMIGKLLREIIYAKFCKLNETLPDHFITPNIA